MSTPTAASNTPDPYEMSGIKDREKVVTGFRYYLVVDWTVCAHTSRLVLSKLHVGSKRPKSTAWECNCIFDTQAIVHSIPKPRVFIKLGFYRVHKSKLGEQMQKQDPMLSASCD